MKDDLASRIAALSPEARALLERRLGNDRAGAQSEGSSAQSQRAFDVIILGGGLAGLTLARQLKRARPDIDILIVEKNKHPVPEAAFKVGEATVEIGAHYFGTVLGMKENLEREQLTKLGLRYFFGCGDNRDIVRRAEMGPSLFPPQPSYQLDRGRLENTLARENVAAGVEFWDDAEVRRVSFEPARRHVVVQRGGEESTFSARWIVDATGRVGIVKRQLGLARQVGHDVNAVWFRVRDRIAVDDWSDDPAWQARCPSRNRYLSTVHLMGAGYWVWLIPLASGATSIGIVAEAATHPFDQFNRLDRAMAWLERNEPQCARVLESQRDRVLDFRILKHFAYGCERVFSADRWCLTGEAGVFTDPLYSPGSDFIGIGNTFITDLILRDFSGEDVQGRLEYYNRIFLGFFETYLGIYQGRYPLMGNGQIMTVKYIWDTAVYWGITALLFFRQKLCNLKFMSAIEEDLQKFIRLHSRMQEFFSEWNKAERDDGHGFFVDSGRIEFFRELNNRLGVDLNDAELRSQISTNVRILEALATEIFRNATRMLALPIGGNDINPYAIGLKPERWQTDGLFSKAACPPVDARLVEGLEQVWFDGHGTVVEMPELATSS